jgi:hypothetical protein
MFGKKTTNELDQRAADLAQQGKDLAAISAERKRREAAAQAATAARESARDTHNKLLNDVDANLDASDDDLSRAKRAHQAARDAEAKAAAALTSHMADHGDLAAPAKRLRQEQYHLDQQRVKIADRADVAEIVRLVSDLVPVLARHEQRLQDAYRQWPEAVALPNGRTIERGAGLSDISFPPGIFDVAPTGNHAGENVQVRTVWKDHVLRAVAEAHPDLLPPAEAPAILARIASDKARGGPRWYARGGIGWDIAPGRRLGS